MGDLLDAILGSPAPDVVPSRYRPFAEARAFARGLHLLDQMEWFAYARGDLARLRGFRPDDIPSNPHWVYRDAGWRGYRDWLGPDPGHPADPALLPFRRARRYARGLGLPSARAWQAWCRGEDPARPPRPANVPADPETAYPPAWRGWEDWLGTLERSGATSHHKPFAEAREFVHGLDLPDVRAWRDYCRGRRPDLGRKPEDVPSCPQAVYAARGWKGYGDWLGTDEIAPRERPHLAFEEARAFARGLGLRSRGEWWAWCRGSRPDLPPRPDEVPTNPNRVYAGRGWAGMGDWLGTGNVREKEFLPCEEAAERARALGIGSAKQWRSLCRGDIAERRRPEDVPADPEVRYRGCGWGSWGEWLGTGAVGPGKRRWRPFREARRFARSLRIPNAHVWRRYVRDGLPGLPPRPEDVPANPEGSYAKRGWMGWADWLGHRNHLADWRPFEEARAFARGLGLRGPSEWREHLAGRRPDLPPLPADCPRAPNAVYREDGWVDWADFLDYPRREVHRGPVLPFEEARAFARSLRLRTPRDWRAWLRGERPDLDPRPPGIPAKHVRE